MPTYRIASRIGADYGKWRAQDAAGALAALHRAAGYTDVRARDGQLCWPDDETREICGGLDVWHVRRVSRGARRKA